MVPLDKEAAILELRVLEQVGGVRTSVNGWRSSCACLTASDLSCCASQAD